MNSADFVAVNKFHFVDEEKVDSKISTYTLKYGFHEC